MHLSDYPYPSYEPNKIIGSCMATLVGISLVAWFIQSYQTRFRPRRPCILLLISHMAIFVELIVHTAANHEERNTRTIFIVMNSLFATGQRMIIMGNFSFVLGIHRENPRLARGILIGAAIFVVTSGVLIAPANLYSFDPARVDASFVFRKLSASLLLIITLLFYVVLFWSKTIADMTMQGVVLIVASSALCLTAAIFNLIPSLSSYYYSEINGKEGWFYGFQMAPIILAHFTWSIFHPKRSLAEIRDSLLTNEEEHLLIEK